MIDTLVWWAVVVWFGTPWAFMAIMKAKAMRDADTLTPFFKYGMGLIVLAIAGVVLDWLFNITYGSIIFREAPNPKELFSNRVQRHVRATGAKRKSALVWAKRLNAVDAGHIKLR